uniref:Capsid protein n=1 Tax=uncultured marine virus TaxID=186617 RepID=S4TDR9_9VIRU|nr:hypothetical protein [uncultured marine virus]
MPIKRSYSQITPGGGGYRKIYKAPKKKTYSVASRSSSALSMSNTLLKTSQVATLRYGLDFSLDPGIAGNPQVHLFSANGCYDPDVTGTGTQPRGFDQMMLLYRHYVVEEAMIELYADPHDSAIGQLISIAVKDGTGPVTRKGVLEETISTMKGLAGSTGGPSAQYLKMSVKPLQFLGTSAKDDGAKGSSTSNPSDQVIFSVSSMPNDQVDSSKVSFVGRITYKVRFLEPTKPPDS